MARNAKAFMVEQGDPRAKEPGACLFQLHWETKQVIGLIHACPCGCGGQTLLVFRGCAKFWAEGSRPDEWDVTGEWPEATLSPSIGIKYDGQGNGPTHYHWHGYLRNGIFEEC